MSGPLFFNKLKSNNLESQHLWECQVCKSWTLSETAAINHRTGCIVPDDIKSEDLLITEIRGSQSRRDEENKKKIDSLRREMENQTLYKCEVCNTFILSETAIIDHEKRCMKPTNKRIRLG